MGIRIAIVGLGKIARDQHIPALTGNPHFELVAGVDPHAPIVAGLAHFESLEQLLASQTEVDAVTLCTPPQHRADLARRALAAGLHVMLEKPPAATVSQAAALAGEAEARSLCLFATWHSRQAGAVAPAREWLVGREVRSVTVTWREDVRRWHPGQTWIWQPGGLGVFDPGINALSIVTELLSAPVRLEAARLEIPHNCHAPVRAQLRLAAGDAPIAVDLDFLQEGIQTWAIEVATDAGTVVLENGGASLTLPGQPRRTFEDAEYGRLYDRFAELVAARRCDVDLAPFALVADAFLLGKRSLVEPFVE